MPILMGWTLRMRNDQVRSWFFFEAQAQRFQRGQERIMCGLGMIATNDLYQ